jgi:Nuclease-related domain
MKVIDYQTAEKDVKKPNALGRAFGDLGFLQSKTMPRAQETTIQSLKKVLDNRFVLLRGLALPEIEQPAPLILIGPPGIWLIEVNANKGIFRAVDDQWEEMDSQTRKYRPAKVNLPARTASQAQIVTTLLTERGLEVQPIEPVILFTQPGAHVKTVRPPARLVQSDAILRFGTSLLQSQIVYEPEELQAFINVLTEPDPEMTKGEPELEVSDQPDRSIQDPSQKDVISSQLSAALNTDEPAIIKRLGRRMTFTSRQWLVLGALLVVNILLFITLILVVLAIT